jgi:GT2 family glycosyltransferase/glycosyltransferase involved in cell wall biosynthesis
LAEERTERQGDLAERIASREERLRELSDSLARERSARRALTLEKLSLERELKTARGAMQAAVQERADELAFAAEEARRIARSRSWRLGHGILRLLRRLTFRRPLRREGAPEALADRLERRLERAPQAVTRVTPGSGQGPVRLPPPVSRTIELTASDLDRLANRPPVSVVIPIHNAAPHLRRCLESVRRNSRGLHELILIDDASTDPKIQEILEPLRGRPGVRVLRNEENLGFSGTVNRGFDLAEGDVVVLNSDTEVTPGWLRNLSFAAYSNEVVGTVTPLSDNAGAFSAPRIGERNPIPLNLPLDGVGRLVTRGSDRVYPAVPIGGGYCLYVRRELLEEAGGMDAERFPAGYGAENDLCMRAGRMGWRHVVDDATIIFHARQASFGDRKTELAAESRRRVNELHPDYTDRIKEFHTSPELSAARKNVKRSFHSDTAGATRTRILFVVHGGGGGTPATTMDLAQALGDGYEIYVLTSDTETVTLHELQGRELVRLEQMRMEPRWKVTDLSREDYREFVGAILVSYAIELVHVRHLIKHPLDVPSVADALGIPVVLSFHDYYLSCTTVHLLDQDLNYCAGNCTPGDGECFTPSPLVRGTPPLKHRWVYRWRDAVNAMLQHADALITTSEHARQVLRRSLFSARDRPLELIEHGRDLEQASGLAEAPTPGGAIRILVPGNLDVHKGTELIGSLRDQDVHGRLEFHFAGNMHTPIEGLGTWHGPYEREEFPSLVARIRPAFIAALSITGETYSHVLTEAWASGVPVIASDIGTFRERVGRHGGGILVDHRDAAAAYRRIIEVADDPAAYGQVSEQANVKGIPTTSDMAAQYDALYGRVLAGDLPPLWLRDQRLPRPRRTDSAGNGDDPRRRGATRPHRPRVASIGLLLVGAEGEHPGSSHVRCLRPLRHPRALADLRAFPLALDRYLEGAADPDVLLVQRNAVPPALIDDFLERRRRSGSSLVLELDDNLIDPKVLEDTHPFGRDDVDAVRQIATASDLVVVSTRRLAEAVSPHPSKTLVVPNMLDETLWLPAYGEIPPSERDEAGPPLKALYMGTTSHRADLALLEPVLEELRQRGVPLELEVIGGEQRRSASGWYTRRPIPAGTSFYPRFAAWLRSEARRWQLAFAPLRDTPFNRCKSDLKFLEYSALGLPGVYSAVGVYDRVCRAGERGLLAENTVAAWADACERLALDAQLRADLRRHAYQHVIGRRRLAVAEPTYLEALASLSTADSSMEETTSRAFARR